jgi:hypothetical protein
MRYKKRGSEDVCSKISHYRKLEKTAFKTDKLAWFKSTDEKFKHQRKEFLNYMSKFRMEKDSRAQFQIASTHVTLHNPRVHLSYISVLFMLASYFCDKLIRSGVCSCPVIVQKQRTVLLLLPLLVVVVVVAAAAKYLDYRQYLNYKILVNVYCS